MTEATSVGMEGEARRQRDISWGWKLLHVVKEPYFRAIRGVRIFLSAWGVLISDLTLVTGRPCRYLIWPNGRNLDCALNLGGGPIDSSFNPGRDSEA